MNQLLLPNIWGRDALFSYSGLEGECSMYGTLCGQLLQDNLGMRLDKKAGEFYFLPRTDKCRLEIVASDVIKGVLNSEYPFAIVALNQKTIVGCAPKDYADFVFHPILPDRELAIEGGKGCEFRANCYVCFSEEQGENIVFAVAKAKEEADAIAAAKEGLKADILAIAEQRIAFFEKVPQVDSLTEVQQKTLSKAFSIMKGQVNSPEGVLTCRYTTPDRIPHRKMYLWDSAFHSIGNVYLDFELAHETLYAVLLGRREDGMVFHCMGPEGGTLERTQPPILAWAYWKLYKKTGRIDWLEEAYPLLAGYLDWNFKNRDQDQNLLFEWFMTPETPDCRCGESGMDNTPRFDTDTEWDAIDFSCFMANEMRYMSVMAKVLNKPEDAAKYADLYQKMGDKINDCLYDEQDGRYYDRAMGGTEFNRVPTVSCFLPLFAGICPPERAKKLVADLMNPETFGFKHMVPTVAANHENFSIDYWRGTTWICYNYLIEQGLRENGFTELADRIVDATIDMVSHWYGREGAIFEVYDPKGILMPSELHRKDPSPNPTYPGAKIQIVRDFGWSSTLYAAMIMEREERKNK